MFVKLIDHNNMRARFFGTQCISVCLSDSLAATRFSNRATTKSRAAKMGLGAIAPLGSRDHDTPCYFLMVVVWNQAAYL